MIVPSNPYGNQWAHLNPQTQENDFLPPLPIGTLTPVAQLISPPPRARAAGPWRDQARQGLGVTGYCSSTRLALAIPRESK